MRWLIVIGVIAFIVVMAFTEQSKDVDAMMRRVRAAKARKAREKKMILSKRAGVSQGGNQTQGEAPAQLRIA